MLAVAGLGGVVLLLACVDPMCGCPPLDTSALANVQGIVVDISANPLSGVMVAPTGIVEFDCSFDDSSAYSGSVAVTDSAGRFAQLVSVFNGPGHHCVEFAVYDSVAGWSDSVFSSAVRFLHHSEAPDTVSIVLEVAR